MTAIERFEFTSLNRRPRVVHSRGIKTGITRGAPGAQYNTNIMSKSCEILTEVQRVICKNLALQKQSRICANAY